MNTIKVIKLNGRYRLHKEFRMSHAIKFSSWCADAGKVEIFLRERYGAEYTWNRDHTWKTHWGKASSTASGRPYYIGVKEEEMIFVARLAGII